MAALTTLIQIWLTLLSIGILGQSDCRQLSLLANMTVVEKIAFESLGRQMCIGKYVDYQYFNARCIQNDPSPGLYQKCREGCLIPILNINFWNTKYQCRSLCFARAKDFTLATCMLACNSLDVMRDHLSDYLKLRFKPYLLPEIATKYNRSLASINFERLPIKKPAPHDKGPTLLPATELKAKEEIMKRIVDPDSSITIPKMCINQAQINLAKQVQAFITPATVCYCYDQSMSTSDRAPIPSIPFTKTVTITESKRLLLRLDWTRSSYEAPKDYFGYTLTWGFQGGDDNCKILKRTTTAFTIVFDKEVPSLCPPIHVTITTYPAKPRSYISENVYFNRDIMKHLPNCHAIIKEVPTSNNMVIKTSGTTHYPGFTNATQSNFISTKPATIATIGDTTGQMQHINLVLLSAMLSILAVMMIIGFVWYKRWLKNRTVSRKGYYHNDKPPSNSHLNQSSKCSTPGDCLSQPKELIGNPLSNELKITENQIIHQDLQLESTTVTNLDKSSSINHSSRDLSVTSNNPVSNSERARNVTDESISVDKVNIRPATTISSLDSCKQKEFHDPLIVGSSSWMKQILDTEDQDTFSDYSHDSLYDRLKSHIDLDSSSDVNSLNAGFKKLDAEDQDSFSDYSQEPLFYNKLKSHIDLDGSSDFNSLNTGLDENSDTSAYGTRPPSQKPDYHPSIYISYFPDREGHSQEAKALTNRLRHLGFNAISHEYNTLAINYQGQGNWVASSIRNADKVIMILSPEYCGISNWLLTKDKSVGNYYTNKSLIDFLRVTQELTEIRNIICSNAQKNTKTFLVRLKTSQQLNALDGFNTFPLLDWPKDENKLVCFLHNVEYYLPKPLPKTTKVIIEADGEVITSVVSEKQSDEVTVITTTC